VDDGWWRMVIELDDAKGQTIESHISVNGTVLGIRLYLDEVVTRRNRSSRGSIARCGTQRSTSSVGVELLMSVSCTRSAQEARDRIVRHLCPAGVSQLHVQARLTGGP